MKTIEERAEKYVNSQCKGCHTSEKIGRLKGYIKGAEEQRDIDIELAYQWIKENWKNYLFPSNDGVMGPPIIEIDEDMNFERDFKEAMKKGEEI